MIKNVIYIFCFLFCSFFSIYAQSVSGKSEKFMYDSKGKRDPFFYIEEKVEQKTEVSVVMTPKEKLKQKGVIVSSIVWDPNNPAILVNDDILEVGDAVQGVVIRAIEQEYVVFEIDGELIEIPMN